MKRWLKWGGIVFGVLVLLIVAFYLEENWRGARLWAQTKAEYEAKGKSFDPLMRLPRPIPDAQNFAASAIWKHFIGAKDGKGFERYKVALFESERAAKKWQSENKAHANWNRGELSPAPPAALFDGAQKDLLTLYEEASARSDCQFLIPYNKNSPTQTELLHLPPCVHLAQALQSHALIQLSKGDAVGAEQDISLIIRLARANADKASSVIEELVGISLYHLAGQMVWQGIETHAWSDAQLETFQKQLSSTNLLKAATECLDNELVLMHLPTIEWVQRHPKFPGAYDLTKYRLFDVTENLLMSSLDPMAFRFYPEKLPDMEQYRKMAKLRAYLNPADLLFLLFVPSDGVIIKSAAAQSTLDLALVACGLERYRLANGKYPATLAELEPKFIERVPHDLCTGEPLHYRVEADGNYTLYSVGFNGVDDGGKVVMKKESAAQIDPKQGDWVWPRSKK